MRCRAPFSLVVFLLVLVVTCWLSSCAREPEGGVVAPDKANLGNEPDLVEMVDTHILRGEVDGEFPEDTQVYPYYLVRHGPAAGIHAFAPGDTVPDRAYVVFKARATSTEPAPQRLYLQGHFAATGLVGGNVPYSFATTYSPAELKPAWSAPHRNLAADTLGFEAGPFRYTVAMRGVLWLGDPEIYRDATPDSLVFYGNYPPCIQLVELLNPGRVPEDLEPESACWEHPGLDAETALAIYPVGDPRFDPDDAGQLPVIDPTAQLWIEPVARLVSQDEPPDPTGWVTIPVRVHRAVIYLHGRDHLEEFPPAYRLRDRVMAWSYQIDHAGDPGNLVREGPGPDDIDLLYGFNVDTNDPDPYASDAFITLSGVWGLAWDVPVPTILPQSPQVYWSYLCVINAAPPPPVDPAELPAWQLDPAVQRAYVCWQLSTAAFGAGEVQVVAWEQARCVWNHMQGAFHFYQGTRIPDPNGRRCIPGFYDQPEQGILELGMLPLADFRAPSDGGRPLVKPFRLVLGIVNGPDFAGGDPPGWVRGRDEVLDLRASRHD